MKKKANKEKSRKAEERAGLSERVSSLRPLLPLLCTAAVIGGAVWGLEQVKTRVFASPAYQPAAIKIVLVSPPEWVVREKWQNRILSGVTVPPPEAWMDEGLTRRMADQLLASGWVKSVERVAKRMDGTIEIAADFRRPIAMVSTDLGYIPVDRDGVCLPEVYDQVEANSGWIRIRGVTSPMPKAKSAFNEKDEADAAAAIKLAALIFDQGWEVSSRISVIDVSNFRGRQSHRECHIKLWTPDGTPIKWGSAIGEEIEENPIAEKLAQIKVILKRGGPQAQVDISTLPSRSIIITPPTIETADISPNRRQH